jgi:hypothetical protein
MTTEENESQKPKDQSPQDPARRKSGPWKQIAIVITSAIVLSVSSCAGMLFSYAHQEALFTLASVGFVIGVVTIPVTIVWAIVALILALVRKRGARE